MKVEYYKQKKQETMLRNRSGILEHLHVFCTALCASTIKTVVINEQNVLWASVCIER